MNENLVLLHYNEPPVQEITSPLLDSAGVRLLVLREDLNHPEISGNKWWKLKYNLEDVILQQHHTILTFGGAYSNHLIATAAATHEAGLKSIGIVRGEETLPLNFALAFAKAKGMHLHYVTREAYRKKTEKDFMDSLHEQFGDFYLIPEGGTNNNAVRGTAEWGQKLLSIDFDYLCLPIGTGGTTAGILAGIDGKKAVVSVSVLKGGDFLKDDVNTLTENNFNKVYGNWDLLTSYHHGGYAKVSEPLLSFIAEMKNRHNLPLDVVYTGKLLWAVLEEVRLGRFKKGSTILAVHTGGY